MAVTPRPTSKPLRSEIAAEAAAASDEFIKGAPDGANHAVKSTKQRGRPVQQTPTTQVSFTAEDSTLTEIDAVASNYGVSRASAVNILIKLGLQKTEI